MAKNVCAVPSIKLNNGYCIPVLGLGTWRLPRNAADVVRDAIDVGYRHFDCALIYRNENEVGAAFKDLMETGIIKREDIFVTSKLWNTYHHPSMVRRGCEISLKNLNLKYLDMYLIHWPMAYQEGDELYPKDEKNKFIPSSVDYVNTYQGMEQLVDEGLCRNIGLSNFNIMQIKRILKVARIPPAILQIECHPYLNQQKLMDFCKHHNIIVTAYSPLGSPSSPYNKPGEYPILEHPTILDIAKKHNKTAAQVLIRYQIERGNIVIPRSSNKEHMIENFSVWNFCLSPENLHALNALDFGGRFLMIADAKGHPHHPFADEFH